MGRFESSLYSSHRHTQCHQKPVRMGVCGKPPLLQPHDYLQATEEILVSVHQPPFDLWKENKLFKRSAQHLLPLPEHQALLFLPTTQVSAEAEAP